MFYWNDYMTQWNVHFPPPPSILLVTVLPPSLINITSHCTDCVFVYGVSVGGGGLAVISAECLRPEIDLFQCASGITVILVSVTAVLNQISLDG